MNHLKILKFLNIARELEKEIPVTAGKELTISWCQVTIPNQGINKLVQAKIDDEQYSGLDELAMLVQVTVTWGHKKSALVTVPVKMKWRGDKEYKYGDITKSKAQFAYYIQRNSRELLDYWFMYPEAAITFLTDYVMTNQYGIQLAVVQAPPTQNYCLAHKDGATSFTSLDKESF